MTLERAMAAAHRVTLRQAQHDKGTKATIYAAENSISEEESQ
jgi:hypothetical protein